MRFLIEMIQDLWDDWLGRFFLLLGVLCILFICGGIYIVTKDAIWWSAYSKAHNCQYIGDGPTKFTTVFYTVNGNVIPTVVANTPHIYKCDDGTFHSR